MPTPKGFLQCYLLFILAWFDVDCHSFISGDNIFIIRHIFYRHFLKALGDVARQLGAADEVMFGVDAMHSLRGWRIGIYFFICDYYAHNVNVFKPLRMKCSWLWHR